MSIELEKYYQDLEPKKLVEIIESIDVYKPEVILYCKEKLSQLKLSKEELKNYSEKVLKKRFYNYFVEGKHFSNENIFIDSYFLSKSEVITCFKESKSEYIKYRENATRGLPSG